MLGMLGGLAGGMAWPASNAWATVSSCASADWPLWQAFIQHLIQADGRVLDLSTPQQHSSSESQSYGMFFALVANDRERFDRLWRWSIANLFSGVLEGRLPAWWWGKASDGSWRVLDANSASDADLWFIYALAEAARVWKAPEYEQDARTLLATVESLEVSEVPQLGTMLRPGLSGFMHEGGRRWQFNPSYLPIPVLRRLAGLSPQGPWSRIATNTATLIRQSSAANALIPDWIAYVADANKGWSFVPHQEKGSIGSYDAIRTYLWAGATSPDDPLAAPVLKSLRGLMAILVRAGSLPESIDVVTGQAKGSAPFGFYAASLPYLQASAASTTVLQTQRQRVEQGLVQAFDPVTLATRLPPYYDLVLCLFGLGWMDRRYRFTRTGALALPWANGCKKSIS